MKPKVFNIGKAQREIEELQGKVIRLSVEVEHYRKKNTPHALDTEDGYRCSKCGYLFCKGKDEKELIAKEGLRNFCPVCGQRQDWG